MSLLSKQSWILPPRDNNNDTPGPPPAPTDRALKLPEILSHIFLCALPNRNTIIAQTARDPTAYRRGLAALARCCRVSEP